ncbi:hypothetical protein ACFLRI_05535, partial [Bacteroidota bacterium]
VVFEVSEKSKKFNPAIKTVVWEDVKIERTDTENEYKVTFSDKVKKAEVIVQPVLVGDDYEEARKIYDRKYQSYLSGVKYREEQEEKKRSKEYQDEQRALALQRFSHNAAIKRVFSIDGFGIWNCDRVLQRPVLAKVNASFIDKKGNPLNFGRIALVEKGINAIFNISNKEFSTLSFNPNSENMIWGLTDENKLAVFRYEDFAKLGKSSGSVTFKMDVMEDELTSEQDIRKFIGI